MPGHADNPTNYRADQHRPVLVTDYELHGRQNTKKLIDNRLTKALELLADSTADSIIILGTGTKDESTADAMLLRLSELVSKLYPKHSVTGSPFGDLELMASRCRQGMLTEPKRGISGCFIVREADSFSDALEILKEFCSYTVFPKMHLPVEDFAISFVTASLHDNNLPLYLNTQLYPLKGVEKAGDFTQGDDGAEKRFAQTCARFVKLYKQPWRLF